MLRYVQREKDRCWFPKPEGMAETMHRLLIQRGISSAEAAEAFLNPDARNLRDPFLLNDMARASDRIRRSMEKG